MRIVFDIMGTVLGAIDRSLRPGIKETIESLRDGGYVVDFWTSGPVEDYRALLRAYGINGAVHSKRERLPFMPDVCVDDEPQNWMPGRVVRVDMHISADAPGEAIPAAQLLFE